MKKITDRHDEYLKRCDQWERCEDAIEGSDAIKGKREKYLPRLPSQSDTEYNGMLLRAIWCNFTGHVLDLFTGLIFSKAVEVDGIDADDPLLVDCDMAGRPFEEFAEEIAEEVIGIGRYGVLVDLSGQITDGMSQAEAERSGARACLVGYDADDITNWHEGRHGGRMALDRLVLHEEIDEIDQYRECLLTESGYQVNIWQKIDGKKDEWIIVDTLIPLMRGKPLAMIPFFFFDADFGEVEPHAGPLLDLVDLNLSHYRTQADLEHAAFFCGIPTPVFAGFSFDEGSVVKLGSMEGISSSDPSAKWGYLEYSGQGLEPLEKRAAQKEQWIAQLGGGLLESDKAGTETATAVRMRKTGSNATLASIAQAISRKLGAALTLAKEWTYGDAGPVTVSLCTEYLPATVTPQEINVLMTGVLNGTVRRIDFLDRLKVGGILPPAANTADIDAELPDAMAGEIAALGAPGATDAI